MKPLLGRRLHMGCGESLGMGGGVHRPNKANGRERRKQTSAPVHPRRPEAESGKQQ